MSHSFHKIWIHLVWSTKSRVPFLNKEILPLVLQHISNKAEQERILFIAINGTANHIHCLLEIGLTKSVATVASLLKGESSHWVNSEKLTRKRFSWQEGYSVFSVSASHLERVSKYIANQEEHHRKKTYQEEILEFQKECGSSFSPGINVWAKGND